MIAVVMAHVILAKMKPILCVTSLARLNQLVWISTLCIAYVWCPYFQITFEQNGVPVALHVLCSVHKCDKLRVLYYFCCEEIIWLIRLFDCIKLHCNKWHSMLPHHARVGLCYSKSQSQYYMGEQNKFMKIVCQQCFPCYWRLSDTYMPPDGSVSWWTGQSVNAALRCILYYISTQCLTACHLNCIHQIIYK